MLCLLNLIDQTKSSFYKCRYVRVVTEIVGCFFIASDLFICLFT